MGGGNCLLRLVNRMSGSPERSRALKLMVCVNMVGVNKPCCGKRGSVALAEAIERGVHDRGIALAVERIHCFNKCHFGPNMRIAPGGEFLHGVSLEGVPKVLDRLQLIAGRADQKQSVASSSNYPGA